MAAAVIGAEKFGRIVATRGSAGSLFSWSSRHKAFRMKWFMAVPVKVHVVLLAEDSEHDIRAIQRVWERNAIPNPLRVVKDGAECMDYLLRRGPYERPEESPWPGLLLLDINLPKLNGFEVLEQLRATPRLRRLPVVVLTTSDREEDMNRSYDLGANAFVTKPVGVYELGRLLSSVSAFWGLAGLPDEVHDGCTRA